MALCFKSQVIYAFATSGATTKTGYTVLLPDTGFQPDNCPGSVVLSKTEYSDFLSNLANFGWDTAAFDVAVQGAFMFFAIGLGIGLLISVIRKLRI